MCRCPPAEGSTAFPRENQIGSSEAPALDELWLRRQIGWIAFRLALLHPFLDEIDLRIRQPHLVGKLQILRLGKPRRHIPRARDFRDLPRMFLDIFIRQQRERRSFARTMARGAGIKDDGSNVSIKCNLLFTHLLPVDC